jgi:hypothetical protein
MNVHRVVMGSSSSKAVCIRVLRGATLDDVTADPFAFMHKEAQKGAV